MRMGEQSGRQAATASGGTSELTPGSTAAPAGHGAAAPRPNPSMSPTRRPFFASRRWREVVCSSPRLSTRMIASPFNSAARCKHAATIERQQVPGSRAATLPPCCRRHSTDFRSLRLPGQLRVPGIDLRSGRSLQARLQAAHCALWLAGKRGFRQGSLQPLALAAPEAPRTWALDTTRTHTQLPSCRRLPPPCRPLALVDSSGCRVAPAAACWAWAACCWSSHSPPCWWC